MKGINSFEQIRIENTNHCGYSCFFCPREQMSRQKGFMDLPSFENILKQIEGFSGLVDLHGFGEPLLDENLISKIKLLKKYCPSSFSRIYSTLGSINPNLRLKSLLNSGLDNIQVSFYGVNHKSYLDTHGVNLFEKAKRNLVELCLLKKDMNSDTIITVRDFPTHDEITPKHTTKKEISEWISFINQLPVESISRKLHNYGEGRKYNTPGNDIICSIVNGYRKRILQITWDLNIIPCCFDSNSTIVLGNLREQSILEIFKSNKYFNFIQAHKNNVLAEYPVCINCERCSKK